MRFLSILGATSCLAFAQLQAAVPLMTGYQGRVQVDGTDFTGNGQFKFALIANPGGASLWSNDGTSVNGSEPAAAITLPVQGGVFSVFLGDPTLPNMQPLTADLFTANPEVYLRIWFDDGVHGSSQLTPDSRLGSVPYALSANVAPGSITSDQLAPAAIDPAKLASANTPQSGQLLSYDGTGFNWTDISTIGTTWALNGTDTYYTAGRVGVGLSAPTATLHVQSSRASGTDNTATFYNPSLGPNASHIHYGVFGDWYIRSAAPTNLGKVILQDTGGNVGIGTAAPAAHLEVTADWLVNGPNILLSGPLPTIQWDAPDNNPLTRNSWIAHVGASHGLEFWRRRQSFLGEGGDTGWQIKAGFTTDGGLWYAGLLDKLDTKEQASATIRAADLRLGHSERRQSGPGRALVDFGNALHLNYNADWADTVIGGKTTIDADLAVNGNGTQPRENGGFVKAMAYVNGDGTLIRSYNAIATTTARRNIGPPGAYIVDFGFKVNDRFISLTSEGGFGNYDWGESANEVWIQTHSSSGENSGTYSDRPFMVFVY